MRGVEDDQRAGRGRRDQVAAAPHGHHPGQAGHAREARPAATGPAAVQVAVEAQEYHARAREELQVDVRPPPCLSGVLEALVGGCPLAAALARVPQHPVPPGPDACGGEGRDGDVFWCGEPGLHRRSRNGPPGGAAVGGFLQSAAVIGHLCQKHGRPGRPRSDGQGGDRGVAGEGIHVQDLPPAAPIVVGAGHVGVADPGAGGVESGHAGRWGRPIRHGPGQACDGGAGVSRADGLGGQCRTAIGAVIERRRGGPGGSGQEEQIVGIGGVGIETLHSAGDAA